MSEEDAPSKIPHFKVKFCQVFTKEDLGNDRTTGYVIYGRGSDAKIIETLVSRFTNEDASDSPSTRTYRFISLLEAGGPTDAVRHQQTFYANRCQYIIRNLPTHRSSNITQYTVPGTTHTVQHYVLALTSLSADDMG